MADALLASGAARGRDRGAPRDRYAAIVAALLDVRTDDATARFDDEIAKAVADHRLDAQTARTLRWWQRTSVRTAESYAATVAADFLAAREHAEAAARQDFDAAATAWETARELTSRELTSTDPKAPAEFAAVRVLKPRPRTAESTRAIRMALASGSSEVDLVTTTVTTTVTTPAANAASTPIAPPTGKDHGHANPATSA